MKINWSWVLLIFLAVVTAFSAAVLVASWRSGGHVEPAPERATVAEAAQDLPPMAIIDQAAVTQKNIPQKDAPAGALAEVVGRSVKTQIKKGAIITQDMLVAGGTGADLASKLPPGMRAVTVSLRNYSGLEYLLYPGCVVDVIVSFSAAMGGGGQERVSTTLLQGIEVLAVEDLTVVTKEPAKEETEGTARRSNQQRLVTLQVTAEQAKKLNLAMEHGTIALALRNPNYQDIVDPRPVVVGDLLRAPDTGTAWGGKSSAPMVPMTSATGAKLWEVTIIRGGGAPEKQVFEWPTEKKPE